MSGAQKLRVMPARRRAAAAKLKSNTAGALFTETSPRLSSRHILTIPKSEKRIKFRIASHRKKALTGLKNLIIVFFGYGMKETKSPKGQVSRQEEEPAGIFRRLREGLRDFIIGAAVMEFQKVAREERSARQDLFLLVAFGDFIGIPILPSPYALRLLPHVIPNLESWKKRMVRKRDLTALGDL
jgi:hypothetical protein